MNKTEWFELKNVELDTSQYNNLVSLKNDLNKARRVRKDSYYTSYIKIKAELVFRGTLQTPNGTVDTEYVYTIETEFDKFVKEARIDIYEQTFTGKSHAVTIRFSSGSIISKIVFGDIEKAYIDLREQIKELVTEYDESIEVFNNEIEELAQAKRDKEDKEQE